MIRKTVTSSQIVSIGHEDGRMQIEFRNGHVYEYRGPKVSEHYDALMAAPSIGAHFSKFVRNCPETVCALVSG